MKTYEHCLQKWEFVEESARGGRELVPRPQGSPLSYTLQRLSETFLLSFSILKNVLRRSKVCSKHLTPRYMSKIVYECKINKPLSPKVNTLSPSISSLFLTPLFRCSSLYQIAQVAAGIRKPSHPMPSVWCFLTFFLGLWSSLSWLLLHPKCEFCALCTTLAFTLLLHLENTSSVTSLSPLTITLKSEVLPRFFICAVQVPRHCSRMLHHYKVSMPHKETTVIILITPTPSLRLG